MARFELRTNLGGKYFFCFRTDDRELIFSSVDYASKKDCQKGIKWLRKNAFDKACYDRKISASDEHFFNILTENCQRIIGTSRHYVSSSDIDRWIEIVKKNIPEAKIIDLTKKNISPF